MDSNQSMILLKIKFKRLTNLKELTEVYGFMCSAQCFSNISVWKQHWILASVFLIPFECFMCHIKLKNTK